MAHSRDATWQTGAYDRHVVIPPPHPFQHRDPLLKGTLVMMTLLTSALLVFIVGIVVLALLDFVAAVLAQRTARTDQRLPPATGIVFAAHAAPTQRRARHR